MPNAWRIRMLSQAGGIDHAAARTFAVTNGIVGAGWGLNGSNQETQVPDGCPDVERYLRHAKIVFPSDSALDTVAAILGTRIKVGDYCWMYVTHTGEYWCCRIEGPFEYRVGGAFDLYDLHMTRRCTWGRAGTADAVPGVIRRAFAVSFGTITAMTTDARTAIEAAELILDSKKVRTEDNLFAAASPEDLEDLVALYLQDKGWRIFPSTSKLSMASYEFVLAHQETGQFAGVQVKSGNVRELNQAVAEDFDLFFVFLANPDAKILSHDPKIQRISRDELEAFAIRHWAILPRRLRSKWRSSQTYRPSKVAIS